MTAVFLFSFVLLGYFLQRLHPILKLKSSRYQTGQHLYFASALFGFMLALCGTFELIVVAYWDFNALVNFIEDIHVKLNKLKVSYATIVAGMIFVMSGITATALIAVGKVRCRNQEYFIHMLSHFANSMEKFLDESIKQVKLVRVQLDSDKVYIGLPYRPVLTNEDDAYLIFIPFRSGYVDDKKNLVLENSYREHYVVKDPKTQRERLNLKVMERYRIIIPMETITLVSAFDMSTYKKISSSPTNN